MNVQPGSQPQQPIELPALCYSVDPSGWYAGYGLCYIANNGENDEEYVDNYLDCFKRVILLNAIVPGHEMVVGMWKLPLTHEYIKLMGLVLRKAQEQGKLLSYIGHQSTAKLVSRVFGINVTVNRGMYEPRSRDLAVVVRLKKRLPRSMDVQEIDVNDIEVWLIMYR